MNQYRTERLEYLQWEITMFSNDYHSLHMKLIHHQDRMFWFCRNTLDELCDNEI